MNQVSIIGNLTRDPEMRTTNNGTPVTSFSIAVNTGWGDNKKTAFIPITVWNKAAESCHQFLNKGSKVAVSGKLDTGSYEKDGKTIYTWEVVANNVEFLTTKSQSNSNAKDNSSSNFNPHKFDDDTPPPFSEDDVPGDDEIPF
ncbi:MAG: single-stranded DNA-binding protein [Candidatus Muirbacterium halophilum]|nr:single-stranded DNA-binding protein [Candidatus Muirbacterium halophilum]MCK9476704.1 single-stranded DNA-binding protein [Candidatus Muirbacterium halophilum]